MRGQGGLPVCRRIPRAIEAQVQFTHVSTLSFCILGWQTHEQAAVLTEDIKDAITGDFLEDATYTQMMRALQSKPKPVITVATPRARHDSILNYRTGEQGATGHPLRLTSGANLVRISQNLASFPWTAGRGRVSACCERCGDSPPGASELRQPFVPRLRQCPWSCHCM